MAKLNFVYGAMNSGKSDSLIKTAYNYVDRGLSIVTIKPAVDIKGGDHIVARAGGKWRVDLLADKTTNLEALITSTYVSNHTTVHCILVDEAQLLQPEQVDQLYRVTKLHDISVVAYGLRTDFKTKVFPGSARLLELADTINKLVTMCRCGEQAEFNCRKVHDAFIFEGEQVAVDGFDEISYDSLCGTCYYKEKQQNSAITKEQYGSRVVSKI